MIYSPLKEQRNPSSCKNKASYCFRFLLSFGFANRSCALTTFKYIPTGYNSAVVARAECFSVIVEGKLKIYNKSLKCLFPWEAN